MLTLPASCPFEIVQRSTLPLDGLCQSRSTAPSPLRSPAPASCEPDGWAPTSTLPAHWALAIFHRSTRPVPALYQTTSLVPSPVRSPTQDSDQPAGWVSN